MAEKLEYRGEVMTFEEALKVEMGVNQALIDLLIRLRALLPKKKSWVR